MLGTGAGEDGLRALLRWTGEGVVLAAASGLAYGCELHACRSGSRPGFRSFTPRDEPERDRVRTSPSSVRFSLTIGTPYTILVSSHRSDNASSVTDTIGEGECGDMAPLDVCCGCGGYAVRPCIFKDGLRIGVAEMVLEGTMSVLEFSLVPLPSPSGVPNSFTALV